MRLSFPIRARCRCGGVCRLLFRLIFGRLGLHRYDRPFDGIDLHLGDVPRVWLRNVERPDAAGLLCLELAFDDPSALHSVAEGPQPWGSWTDIYRDVCFPQIDQTVFQWNLAPKWLRNGGRDFTLVFSGTGTNDSGNVIDGSFATQ